MIGRLVITLLAMLPGEVLPGQLPEQPHIYVHGEGRVEFAPESVAISVRYSAAAENALEAKRGLEARISSLLKAARDHGIEDSDITASSASLDPDARYVDGDRIQSGIQVSRAVNIALHDLDLYSTFAQAVYETGPSSMSISLMGRADGRIAAAQRAAVADARQRATILAESLGMSLSGVYSLSEFDLREEERYGLHPSTGLVSNDQHGGGLNVASPPPLSGDRFLPGVITATATVYVVYLLEEPPVTPTRTKQ